MATLKLKRVLLGAVGVVMLLSVAFQVWQAWSFMNAGPRFTAQDGQALCERVAKLEPQPQPCRYGSP